MTAAPIIVTGFRAFPGVANNPSALVVEALGDGVATVLLETVYDQARQRIAALLDREPAALVLTGYSRLATDIVLETRATAACLPQRADAAGCLPEALVGGGDYANTAVDAAALAERLAAAGLPVSLSSDAGGYLCNHVFWQALDLIAERGLGTRTIFVHLPLVEGMDNPPDGAGAMALADLVLGVRLIATGLAQQH